MSATHEDTYKVTVETISSGISLRENERLICSIEAGTVEKGCESLRIIKDFVE